MKDLFISKTAAVYPLSGTVAGIWEIDSIPTGGLAMFNQDGSIISDATSVFNIVAADITGDSVTISLTTADGTTKNSISIPRDGFEYSKRAYAAPVAAVKILGSDTATGSGTYSLNLPSTIAVGDIAGVIITDKSKAFDVANRSKEYSITVVNGDLLTGVTAKNIITKLVAIINADSLCPVTAVAHNDATNNTGIKFTADTAGVDFDLANVSGILETSDILEYNVVNGKYVAFTTNLTAGNIGHGTAAQVKLLEDDLLTRDGKHVGRVLENEMWKATSNVVAGETYVSYILRFTPPTDAPNQRDPNYPQIINVCVPVELTTVGDVLTSGDLVTGHTYTIIDWITTDDFTNVGGANVDGTIFVATGTTPTTWTNSSTVQEVNTGTEYTLDKILALI